MNDNGINVFDPKKVAEPFNKYFVNVGPNIDCKIPKPLKHFKDYMTKLKVKKNILLNPCNTQGII